MSEARNAVSTSPCNISQLYLVAIAISVRIVVTTGTGAKVSLKSIPACMKNPLMTSRLPEAAALQLEDHVERDGFESLWNFVEGGAEGLVFLV